MVASGLTASTSEDTCQTLVPEPRTIIIMGCPTSPYTILLCLGSLRVGEGSCSTKTICLNHTGTAKKVQSSNVGQRHPKRDFWPILNPLVVLYP